MKIYDMKNDVPFDKRQAYLIGFIFLMLGVNFSFHIYPPSDKLMVWILAMVSGLMAIYIFITSFMKKS